MPYSPERKSGRHQVEKWKVVEPKRGEPKHKLKPQTTQALREQMHAENKVYNF